MKQPQNEHECHHEHAHGPHDECTCNESSSKETQNYWIRGRMHDDAIVISAECKVAADYTVLGAKLTAALEEMASVIADKGGIIGHIKTALEIKAVEMYSLTDTTVSIKRADEQEILVQIAAIVFFVELDEMECLVRSCIIDKLMVLQRKSD